MSPGSASSLVEFHHLLPLLKQPEERSDTTHVENVGTDTHDVIQNPGHFTKKH